MNDIHAVKAIVNGLIRRECERCRDKMGDAQWAQHSEWVIENIVASAMAWMFAELKEGRL